MLCFYVCEQKFREDDIRYHIIKKFESMEEALYFAEEISADLPIRSVTVLDAEEYDYYEYLVKSKQLQRNDVQ
ncbi:hypothetical protein [Ectobacillus panaciterrae]|uniref:hypothetical protein n=1 Tax=Ectobacillus panaciterrae TaxID=363872 RepID=UPI0004299397|nr:hypothetical protein [Ectobacillus panaciterrae]